MDASSLTLSDMGNMNNGGFGGGFSGIGSRDGAPGGTAQTGTALILVGLSALVLLAGLLAAFKFKRK